MSSLCACATQMMLSQADELAMEGQFDEALVHYEKALDSSPQINLLQKKARKVQQSLSVHFIQKQEQALQQKNWTKACQATQKLLQVEQKKVYEDHYLEAARIHFEELVNPRPQWDSIQSFFAKLNQCSVKSIQEVYHGMLAQVRFMANLQLQSLIQKQKLPQAQRLYQQLKKSKLPLEILDVWEQQFIESYVTYSQNKAQHASNHNLWGEFWIYHTLHQSYKRKGKHSHSHSTTHKGLKSSLRESINRAGSQALSDMNFYVSSDTLHHGSSLKSNRNQLKSTRKQQEVQSIYAVLEKALNQTANIPTLHVNYHTTNGTDARVTPVKVAKIKKNMNTVKKTVHISPNELIKLAKTHLSSFPQSSFDIHLQQQTVQCKKTKEERNEEVRSIDSVQKVINPQWQAAIQRVEKQQNQYEANLSKIEELNHAYQKSLEQLTQLIDQNLNPLEQELSQSLELFKQHKKTQESYKNEINHLREQKLKYTVRKKEEARYHTLLKTLAKSKIQHETQHKRLKENPFHTIQWTLLKRTDLLWRLFTYVGSTIHPILINHQIEQMQKKLQTLQAQNAPVKNSKDLQKKLDHTISESKKLTQESLAHIQKLNQVQTQVTEYRNKKSQQQHELKRVKGYLIQATKTLVNEKEELENLEVATKKLEQYNTKEHYIIFRYPVFEHIRKCVVKWDLAIYEKGSHQERIFHWEADAVTRDKSHLAYFKYHIPRDRLQFPMNKSALIFKAQNLLIQRLIKWIQEKHWIHLKEVHKTLKPMMKKTNRQTSKEQNFSILDLLAKLSVSAPKLYEDDLFLYIKIHYPNIAQQFIKSLATQLALIDQDVTKNNVWYQMLEVE